MEKYFHSKYIFPGALILFFLLSQRVDGRTLELDSVMNRALEVSVDLRIAGEEIAINKSKRDEAFSLFYPSLSVRFNSEYVHSPFQDNETAEMTQAGNTVSADERLVSAPADYLYRHALSLNLKYLVSDFGVRGVQLDNADRDIRIAELNSKQIRSDIKNQVLDFYLKGLRLYMQKEAGVEILERQKELFRMYQDLRVAGSANELDVSSAAISVAETVNKVDDLNRDLQGVLNQLSVLTNEYYQAENVVFSGLTSLGEQPLPLVDAEGLPEILVYDLEIEKKRDEEFGLKREQLPRVSFYCSYRLYGTDYDDIGVALNDMEENNSTIGLIVEFDLFEGFGDMARLCRLQAELRRLQLLREQALMVKQQEVDSLIQTAITHEKNRQEWQQFQEETVNKIEMAQRLAAEQITDMPTFLRMEIDTLENKAELNLRDMERRSNLLRLQLVAEGRK